MEQKSLNTFETREALVSALTILSSSGNYLNQLDQALGDGDHGSTIARGSDAAIRDLQARTFLTVNQEFEVIGSSMMHSMGGASGILFGVLFRAAKNCQPSETMNAATLAGFLRRGLDELRRKSQAAVGDKTMMDAFVPAVDALEAKKGNPWRSRCGRQLRPPEREPPRQSACSLVSVAPPLSANGSEQLKILVRHQSRCSWNPSPQRPKNAPAKINDFQLKPNHTNNNYMKNIRPPKFRLALRSHLTIAVTTVALSYCLPLAFGESDSGKKKDYNL